MLISTGCKDHPLGSNPKVYIPQPSSLRGYPISNTNIEGPKGISNRNAREWNKGIIYCSYEKYSLGHKCREQKFFQIDASILSSYEYIPSYEAPDQEDAQPSVHVEYYVVAPEELFISLHALLGILAPQTLNIKGYIKHRPIVVLIDSGITHNFIHCRLVEETDYFVYPFSNY